MVHFFDIRTRRIYTVRKKVVLINPVKIRDSYATLALGPLTIGTILKENEFDISIIDFNYLWEKKILNKEKSIKELLEDMADYILAKYPSVVGFSTISTCHHVAVEVSKLLKEKMQI